MEWESCFSKTYLETLLYLTIFEGRRGFRTSIYAMEDLRSFCTMHTERLGLCRGAQNFSRKNVNNDLSQPLSSTGKGEVSMTTK